MDVFFKSLLKNREAKLGLHIGHKKIAGYLSLSICSWSGGIYIGSYQAANSHTSCIILFDGITQSRQCTIKLILLWPNLTVFCNYPKQPMIWVPIKLKFLAFLYGVWFWCNDGTTATRNGKRLGLHALPKMIKKKKRKKKT